MATIENKIQNLESLVSALSEPKKKTKKVDTE